MADRTLIIGGTGVIGHYVTRRLVEAGERPVVLSPTGNRDLIGDVADHVDIVRGSVAEMPGLSAVVRTRGVTRIAHLGALLHGAAEADPAQAVRIAVEGTVNVLEAARQNGVRRVVMASSKGAYGPVSGEHGHPMYRPLTEDFCPRPASIYGITKLAGEQLGRWYRGRHGLQFAAIRFGSTVGPGKLRRHAGTSIHSTMVENAMLSRPTSITAGGEAVTDTIYNDDAARGVIAALDAPALPSALYNIATGIGITLQNFAAAVREVFPEASIEVGPGTQYLRPDSTGHCVLDIARARRELGYEPNLDIAGWIRGYVGTMQRLGLAPTPS